jgi:hypothetical protein
MAQCTCRLYCRRFGYPYCFRPGAEVTTPVTPTTITLATSSTNSLVGSPLVTVKTSGQSAAQCPVYVCVTHIKVLKITYPTWRLWTVTWQTRPPISEDAPWQTKSEVSIKHTYGHESQNGLEAKADLLSDSSHTTLTAGQYLSQWHSCNTS